MVYSSNIILVSKCIKYKCWITQYNTIQYNTKRKYNRNDDDYGVMMMVTTKIIIKMKMTMMMMMIIIIIIIIIMRVEE